MSNRGPRENDRDRKKSKARNRHPQPQMADGRKSQAKLIEFMVVLLISVLVVTIDLIFISGTNHV